MNFRFFPDSFLSSGTEQAESIRISKNAVSLVGENITIRDDLIIDRHIHFIGHLDANFEGKYPIEGYFTRNKALKNGASGRN
ncbi:MAG: hypothetical protein VW455_13130 [Nitrospinota bacterium]